MNLYKKMDDYRRMKMAYGNDETTGNRRATDVKAKGDVLTKSVNSGSLSRITTRNSSSKSETKVPRSMTPWNQKNAGKSPTSILSRNEMKRRSSLMERRKSDVKKVLASLQETPDALISKVDAAKYVSPGRLSNSYLPSLSSLEKREEKAFHTSDSKSRVPKLLPSVQILNLFKRNPKSELSDQDKFKHPQQKCFGMNPEITKYIKEEHLGKRNVSILEKSEISSKATYHLFKNTNNEDSKSRLRFEYYEDDEDDEDDYGVDYNHLFGQTKTTRLNRNSETNVTPGNECAVHDSLETTPTDDNPEKENEEIFEESKKRCEVHSDLPKPCNHKPLVNSVNRCKLHSCLFSSNKNETTKKPPSAGSHSKTRMVNPKICEHQIDLMKSNLQNASSTSKNTATASLVLNENSVENEESKETESNFPPQNINVTIRSNDKKIGEEQLQLKSKKQDSKSSIVGSPTVSHSGVSSSVSKNNSSNKLMTSNAKGSPFPQTQLNININLQTPPCCSHHPNAQKKLSANVIPSQSKNKILSTNANIKNKNEKENLKPKIKDDKSTVNLNTKDEKHTDQKIQKDSVISSEPVRKVNMNFPSVNHEEFCDNSFGNISKFGNNNGEFNRVTSPPPAEPTPRERLCCQHLKQQQLQQHQQHDQWVLSNHENVYDHNNFQNLSPAWDSKTDIQQNSGENTAQNKAGSNGTNREPCSLHLIYSGKNVPNVDEEYQPLQEKKCTKSDQTFQRKIPLQQQLQQQQYGYCAKHNRAAKQMKSVSTCYSPPPSTTPQRNVFCENNNSCPLKLANSGSQPNPSQCQHNQSQFPGPVEIVENRNPIANTQMPHPTCPNNSNNMNNGNNYNKVESQRSPTSIPVQQRKATLSTESVKTSTSNKPWSSQKFPAPMSQPTMNNQKMKTSTPLPPFGVSFNMDRPQSMSINNNKNLGTPNKNFQRGRKPPGQKPNCFPSNKSKVNNINPSFEGGPGCSQPNECTML